jgi:hypothetical protein
MRIPLSEAGMDSAVKCESRGYAKAGEGVRHEFGSSRNASRVSDEGRVWQYKEY